MLKNPYPGNPKFEPPRLTDARITSDPAKVDYCAHQRDVTKAPLIEKYSPRKELWT